MGEVKAIELTTDVRETIETMLKNSDNFQAVVILALDKDGSQQILSSSMNAMEKAFLCQFHNAWMNKWFTFSGD